MTSMNFLTLPYNCVTISFLPEIWFWGPTHPTFLYDVTLFSLFFFEGFPYTNLPILIGSFLLPMTDNQDILWLPLHSCILYSMLSFLISMAFIDLPYFLEFTIVLIMNQLSNFEFTNTYLD